MKVNETKSTKLNAVLKNLYILKAKTIEYVSEYGD